jgi:hypothetical protein
MSADMPTYAELQAENALLRREMLRYLLIIEKAEQYRHTWAFLTEGTGVVTANSYREALQQKERT